MARSFYNPTQLNLPGVQNMNTIGGFNSGQVAYEAPLMPPQQMNWGELFGGLMQEAAHQRAFAQQQDQFNTLAKSDFFKDLGMNPQELYAMANLMGPEKMVQEAFSQKMYAHHQDLELARQEKLIADKKKQISDETVSAWKKFQETGDESDLSGLDPGEVQKIAQISNLKEGVKKKKLDIELGNLTKQEKQLSIQAKQINLQYLDETKRTELQQKQAQLERTRQALANNQTPEQREELQLKYKEAFEDYRIAVEEASKIRVKQTPGAGKSPKASETQDLGDTIQQQETSDGMYTMAKRKGLKVRQPSVLEAVDPQKYYQNVIKPEIRKQSRQQTRVTSGHTLKGHTLTDEQWNKYQQLDDAGKQFFIQNLP